MTTLVSPSPLPVFEAPSGIAAQRVAATNAVTTTFFGEHADAIAQTCQAMAVRFEQGGRLLVCGDHAQRSDVAHVVVEFMHPVVVGKRALPALALPGIVNGDAEQVLAVVGRAHDMLLVLSAGMLSRPTTALLAAARVNRMLTIALTGECDRATPGARDQHLFAVPSSDPCLVQETHEMLYHVLWELVHVFFDNRGLRQQV